MNSIKLNKHGNNAAIKYHILTEDKMKKAGFRKTSTGWYFFKPLDKRSRISYNVSIPFDEDGRIDILDEDFVSHTIMNTYWRKIRILVLLK